MEIQIQALYLKKQTQKIGVSSKCLNASILNNSVKNLYKFTSNMAFRGEQSVLKI